MRRVDITCFVFRKYESIGLAQHKIKLTMVVTNSLLLPGCLLLDTFVRGPTVQPSRDRLARLMQYRWVLDSATQIERYFVGLNLFVEKTKNKLQMQLSCRL